MIPFTDAESLRQLFAFGTVFTMTRYKNGKVEHFILENDEVRLTIEELQDDLPSAP